MISNDLLIVRIIKRSCLILFFLISWQIISGVILPKYSPSSVLLFPSPATILLTAFKMLRQSDIYFDMLISIRRVLSSFGISCLIGLPLGISMGRWKTVEDIVDPLVSMLRPIPPIAWIPLGILWFGIGENEKVFVIWWAAFFPILVNSISGVRGIDKIYVSAILTMGGNEKQVLKDVVFWGSLPSIFVGLRLGLGNAWMALVAGELVAASSGLGFMMQNARQYLATDKVIIGMILIGILGLSMDIGMRYLLKRLMPWVEGLKIG